MTTRRERWKKLAAWAAELGVTFTLVVVCYVALLGVMGLSFPRGPSLRDLMGASAGIGSGGAGLRLDLGMDARSVPIIASLSRVLRRVKDRPPDALAWSEAEAGTPLQDRHAVQTFARSGATITFGAREQLQLSENSLIILRRLEKDAETGRRRAALVMMEGELSARLDGRRGGAMDVEIETGEGAFRLSGGGRRPADFKLTVSSDRGSTIALYEGQGSVSAQGRTVRLLADHAVTVLPGKAPGAPVRLAARPAVRLPLDGASRRFREDAAEVRFEWSAQSDAEGYRLQLARDPVFSDLVHDRRQETAGFTHGRLGEGSYFWRVSALKEGIEGPPSAPRRLNLVQDREPPALSVQAPARIVEGRSLLVRGEAEPGCRVLAGEQEAAVESTGQFVLVVPLAPGQNVIVVEAIDSAGNIAYHSLLVTAKHSERRP